MHSFFTLPVPLLLLASPALAASETAEAAPSAEEAAKSEDAADDTERHGGEILVVAERIRGQVEAPLPPIAVLDEKDIQALGATTLADVLT